MAAGDFKARECRKFACRAFNPDLKLCLISGVARGENPAFGQDFPIAKMAKGRASDGRNMSLSHSDGGLSMTDLREPICGDPAPSVPQYVAYAVSLIAGAQGNAFDKYHGMLCGNVAVTFVVQMAFGFLVQRFFKKTGIKGESNISWSGRYFLVLLGFGGGSVLGACWISMFSAPAALLLAAIIVVIIGVIAIKKKGEPGMVDPSPVESLPEPWQSRALRPSSGKQFCQAAG